MHSLAATLLRSPATFAVVRRGPDAGASAVEAMRGGARGVIFVS